MFSYNWKALLLASMGISAIGCDPGSASRADRERGARTDTVARELGVDAGDLVLPTDPPPLSGDFKAEADRFTTLDACVAEHASLDPLVGDALDAIGYDTFLRDACRVLEAAHQRSRAPCAAIDASVLRERCVETVAILAAAPDDCPMRLSRRPALGRIASCVAIASRDARLCVAEEPARRPTCEALASGEAKRCGGNERDPAIAKCRRASARFRSAIDAPSAARVEMLKARGTLTITPKPGAPPLDHDDIPLATMLGPGVVIVEGFEGARIEVGSVRELGAGTHVPAPTHAPRVAAMISLGAGRGAQARIEHFELEIPGAATLVCPGVECALHVTTFAFERKRGGSFSVTLEGTVARGPQAYAVRLDAATFVRDIVSTLPDGTSNR